MLHMNFSFTDHNSLQTIFHNTLNALRLMKWNLTNVIVECASLADECAYIKWDYFCVENY